LAERIVSSYNRTIVLKEGSLFIAGLPLGSNNEDEAKAEFVELLKVKQQNSKLK
jgi:hypothetical protein